MVNKIYMFYNGLIKYLRKHQNSDGSYDGCTCPYMDEKAMLRDAEGRMGFSAYILWNLSIIDDEIVSSEIMAKVESFLWKKRARNGDTVAWRWAPSLNADFDCTVLNYSHFRSKGIKIYLDESAFIHKNECQVWENRLKEDDIVKINSIMYYKEFDSKKCNDIVENILTNLFSNRINSDYYLYSDCATAFHLCMVGGFSYIKEESLAEFRVWLKEKLMHNNLCKVEKIYIFYAALAVLFDLMNNEEKNEFLKKICALIDEKILLSDTLLFKGPAEEELSNQWKFGGTCLYCAYLANLLNKTLSKMSEVNCENMCT